MNRLLEVFLVAMTLATNMPSASAQAPALQKGISVQMATTSNATPMPAADNDDAWIITIGADGKLFFGTDLVNADALMNDVRIHPRKRDAKLYIKADARAPFSSVYNVMKISRSAYFESVIFLTNQNETPALGKMISPQGLEVLISPPRASAVVVELHNSGQPQPAVKVNNQEIARSNLQTMLNQSLQDNRNRIVEIKADGSLLFAQVAQVIDDCVSVKAKVVLTTEE